MAPSGSGVIPVMIVIGIDEAGRGAEVGPLVVAAVAIEADELQGLIEGGLKDSKGLTPSRREALAQRIRRAAVWTGAEVAPAAVVDRYVGRPRRSLNSLERLLAARLLRRAPAACRVIADGARLFGALARRGLLVALDHADVTFPEVTSAGLIAKVRRDELLGEIDERVASLVGRVPRNGYPGAETSAWIKRYQEFFGGTPPEVRATWYRGARVATVG